MRRVSLALFLTFLLAWSYPAAARPLTGHYVTTDNALGTIEVSIQEQAGKQVAGHIRISGHNYPLTGKIDSGTATGTVQGPEGTLFFEAEMEDDLLIFSVIGRNSEDQPNYQDVRELRMEVVREPAQADTDSLFSASQKNAATADSQGPDPMLGSFANRQISMSLSGGGGQYSGQIRYLGKTYTLVVEGRNGLYVGQINGPDGPMPVQMSLRGDSMFVQTASGAFALNRQDEVAAAHSRAGTNPVLALGNQGAGQGRMPTGLAPEQPKMAAGGLDDGTNLGREWSQYLAGKKVTYISSYSSGSAGGYSARTDVLLCRNGTFQMRGNSTVAADTGGVAGYAGGNQGGSGRWHILTQGQRVGIRLQYASGQTALYELTHQNGRTFANGDRVYVTPGGC